MTKYMMTKTQNKKIFKTLISPDRYSYIDLHIAPIVTSGDICEIGVYKGGSLAHLAELFPERTIIGIDTFDGLPEPGEHDRAVGLGEFEGHNKGDFGDVDYFVMYDLFARAYSNVQLVKGLFPDEGVIEKIKDKIFCFVHVDCDLYQSVKDCCEYFYPRLPDGGIMLFDDYGFSSTPGAKVAVDEYFTGVSNCIIRHLSTKQCFVYKKEDVK